jgi:hypothetical protein
MSFIIYILNYYCYCVYKKKMNLSEHALHSRNETCRLQILFCDECVRRHVWAEYITMDARER